MLAEHAVICGLCNACVNKRNLHVHKNSADCVITVATAEAKKQHYVYDPRIARIAAAPWAEPFCKKFRTGRGPRRIDIEDRTWAKDWWWSAYCQVVYLPNRIELLESIKDLWEVGNMEALEAHLGGIELLRT